MKKPHSKTLALSTVVLGLVVLVAAGIDSRPPHPMERKAL